MPRYTQNFISLVMFETLSEKKTVNYLHYATYNFFFYYFVTKQRKINIIIP
jgi:hypothetical protein